MRTEGESKSSVVVDDFVWIKSDRTRDAAALAASLYFARARSGAQDGPSPYRSISTDQDRLDQSGAYAADFDNDRSGAQPTGLHDAVAYRRFAAIRRVGGPRLC